MLQQGWYGCYDCTNYAAERDPDQLTDYRYILYKVYSRYRRHKAAQIKSAFEPQVKLVRREHDAHCAARKQKRDYYLYQVRKVRPAQKGSHQKIVHCLARLTCRDQYQCDCSEERTKNMLLSLGRKELEKLRDEDPRCEVVCHFCHTKYEFDLNELLAETTPDEK